MEREVYRLTPELTQDGRAVRTQVFIQEQGFLEEYDETDKTALHMVCYIAGEPVAAGRLFPKAETPEVYRIGRVAVRQPWRGRGLGARLMLAMERAARERGAETAELMAQVQAQGFYAKLGYRPFGPVFYEEHCPHQAMRKSLKAGWDSE